MDTSDNCPQKMPAINSGNNGGGGFLSWLRHPQRGLPYLICSIVAILVILPLLTHYYISAFDDVVGNGHESRSRHERNGRFGSTKSSELKSQIDELRTIKTSVSNELLELERKRQSLLTDISGYTTAIDELKQSYRQTSEELGRLKVSLTSLQMEQRELLKNNLPNIEAPSRILPPANDALPALPLTIPHQRCQMYNCFDFSRCSVTSQFPVYVYPPDETSLSSDIDSFVKYTVAHAFDASPHITYDPSIACLYIVLIANDIQTIHNGSTIEHLLAELPYWQGSGVNHLLLSVSRKPSPALGLSGIDTGAAVFAQSFFSRELFRLGYDIVVPPALGISHGDTWELLPLLVPAHRKYLITFVGEQNYVPLQRNFDMSVHGYKSHRRSNASVQFTGQQMSHDETIVKVLKTMQTSFESDHFYFEFICSAAVKQAGVNGEWVLCGTEEQQKELLQMSTFRLIIAPVDSLLVSSEMLQSSLFLALKYGSVPVILGDVQLPFQEAVLWSRAVIILPKARVTELHFFLRSYTDADILEMRRYGRLVFETHFASTRAIIDTTLASIRHRLRIPAFPIKDEPSPSVFNDSFVPLHEAVVESMVEVEEMLGPIEHPIASPRYYRNFTFTEATFALPADPFHSYPFTPFEPLLPGDAKFLGSTYGFRPIGQGAGGTGKEFSEALGGNIPREQFTVVILTYEREGVLINAISRLKGLPHLNKVVVVWNSPQAPAEDLHWPDIGVSVHVIRTARNSLNSRFLPFDVIETEAVLSVDDDAHLRHDEIMFGFRVWREARDRIVGFPGRYHAWDVLHQNWLYNSNYSCELSVVLTGAAFLHKYYMYVYSYVMPQAIRDKVDEYLNCEDLAMNFLVSHITRKPPIKVTSRWTFRCPGCPKALSVEDSHFTERHKCMNFFVQVYGYMPLLNTQFRADSVLFKTRISHDKQKCFKFI